MIAPNTLRGFLCATLLGLSIHSVALAEDWKAWLNPQGLADGNAVTGEALPATDRIDLESVAWRAKVGIGFSSVAVADGRVFTIGHNGDKGPRGSGGKEMIWCFDADSGEVIWKADYDAPLLPNLHDGGPGATPVVEAGRVFTVSKDGQAQARKADSGELLWSRELMAEVGMRRPPEWGFSGSPLVVAGAVLFEAGATLALDIDTGKLLWKSEKFTPGYGSPSLLERSGRQYLAALKTEGLVILDLAEKGATAAFHAWKTSFQTNANSPLVIGDQLFVSTGYDRGCTLLKFDGSALSAIYENRTMCNHMANSVLIDGHLYGFDGTAHRGREVELVCMELATGTEKWRHKGLKYGTLIGAGDRLVVLSERGELLIGEASPDGWNPSHEEQVLGGRCWTMPIWSNGLLYCRNSRGDLIALTLSVAEIK
jgi:outer membrane protein assembly factor BamB